jgi:hypothetical protein
MKFNSILTISIILFIILLLSTRIDILWLKPNSLLDSASEAKILNAIIPDFQVSENAQIPAGKGHPAIAVDGSGNFTVVWTDNRHGNEDIYAQRYTSEGTALGSNFKVNDDFGMLMQRFPSISVDSSGNFIIVWEDNRTGNNDIFTQLYSSDGTTLGSNFKVNDDIGNAWQGYSFVYRNGNANFIITWADDRDGNSDIYAQRYSHDGIVLGSNFKVNDDTGTAGQNNPSISADDSGKFCIAWGDERNGNWDIYIQRYSSNGTTLGSNSKVNDDQGNIDHNYPSISINCIGSFIISWWDGRSGGGDIYAQRYTSNGIPLGSNFKVNDDIGNSDQWSTKNSVCDSGNFVITWWDTRNNDRDVYAQCYSYDGIKLGINFLVTSTGNGMQRYPDVKLWNKRIYNTWEDDRAGGTGIDIWANVLDWDAIVRINNDEPYQITSEIILHQNYANPFNPSTTIQFDLPKTSNVTLKIFNILGEEVATLASDRLSTGSYSYEWDASNLASGLYLYRLEAGDYVETKKMVLMR